MGAARSPLESLGSARLNFIKLWLGQGLSNLGTAVSMLAIPALAILEYDATAFEASVLGAAGAVPFMLFSLLAGPIVDRLPRRSLLIACDIGRFAAIAILVTAHTAGFQSLGYLYLAAFVIGSFTVLFDIAFLSFVPQILPPKELVKANSWLVATSSVTEIVGPSVGGFLITLFGAARALVVDAFSYLLSILALFTMRSVGEPERSGEKASVKGIVREIGEGLVFVRRKPVLLRIAMATAVADFGQAMIEAVYLVFLFNSLDLGPGVVGVVLAVPAATFTIGAMLSPRITQRFGLGRTMAYSILIGMGIELLTPVALLGWAFAVLVMINAVAGFTNATYDINQLSSRQVITPPEMQGRVHATMRMSFQGPTPFGFLAGGALATTIGVAGAIFVGAVVSTIGATILMTKVIRSLHSMDDLEMVGAAGNPLES